MLKSFGIFDKNAENSFDSTIPLPKLPTSINCWVSAIKPVGGRGAGSSGSGDFAVGILISGRSASAGTEAHPDQKSILNTIENIYKRFLKLFILVTSHFIKIYFYNIFISEYLL